MGSVKSQRAAGKTNWLRHGSVLHPSHQTAVGLPTSPGGRVGAIQRTSLGHAGTLIPFQFASMPREPSDGDSNVHPEPGPVISQHLCDFFPKP